MFEEIWHIFVPFQTKFQPLPPEHSPTVIVQKGGNHNIVQQPPSQQPPTPANHRSTSVAEWRDIDGNNANNKHTRWKPD